MNKKDLSDRFLDEIKRNLMEQEEEDDEDENETEETQDENGGSSDFDEMVSRLLHSQTQVHIFHLGVKGSGSYAAHKALQRYYEGIDALVDGLIESFQGRYGLVTNYETYDMDKFESVTKCISYLIDLNKVIIEKRKSVKDSYLQNQIDTVQELLFSTLYKLKFLK
jgi:DNA-binding ferritin-like protein